MQLSAILDLLCTANLATRKTRQIKSALRDVLSDDFNLTRTSRQIDRTDSILGNFNLRDEDGSEYPLHEPTGEKTRKTYDFTSKQRLHTAIYNLVSCRVTNNRPADPTSAAAVVIPSPPKSPAAAAHPFPALLPS